jgi:hypothetical protein
MIDDGAQAATTANQRRGLSASFAAKREAIEKAAEEFNVQANRLITIRR